MMTLWPGSGVCGPASLATLLGAAAGDALPVSLALEPAPPHAASATRIEALARMPARKICLTVIAIPQCGRSGDVRLLRCEQCLTPKDASCQKSLRRKR